jgi:hypothetical protein
MRQFNRIFLASLVLVSVAVMAQSDKDSVGTLVASELLWRLQNVKSLDDVPAILGMSTSDEKLYRQDIVAFKGKSYVRPELRWVPKAIAQMSFGKTVYSLDFREISNGVIALNGTPISLKGAKTYTNFRAIVEGISRKKNKAVAMIPSISLFPLAWGQSEEQPSLLDRMVLFVGDHTVGAAVAATKTRLYPQDLKDVAPADVTSAIVTALQHDAEDFGKTNLRTFVMTCDLQKHQLTKITQSMLVDGQSVQSPRADDPTLTYNGKDGWIETVPDCSVVPIEIASDNSIETYTATKKDQSNCPQPNPDQINVNFLEHGPFYAYPQVAQQCCQQSGLRDGQPYGCYKQYQDALAQIIRQKDKALPFNPFKGVQDSP